ncbi:hypothetical protein K503DRAFT_804834 [Rhizopogon vinicolor AM-OR11-026]|uniref:Uncharacterized protein n=1 Tax=Rhizopogon vinicolor AM-OR11-026 TaxID=1314800 RepID=A0A1B7MJV5_9AGAM|nr:hypothetical protein K503DRAFT_804834 [Rhizopogon vinicolor AM-OR11-026]
MPPSDLPTGPGDVGSSSAADVKGKGNGRAAPQSYWIPQQFLRQEEDGQDVRQENLGIQLRYNGTAPDFFHGGPNAGNQSQLVSHFIIANNDYRHHRRSHDPGFLRARRSVFRALRALMASGHSGLPVIELSLQNALPLLKNALELAHHAGAVIPVPFFQEAIKVILSMWDACNLVSSNSRACFQVLAECADMLHFVCDITRRVSSTVREQLQMDLIHVKNAILEIEAIIWTIQARPILGRFLNAGQIKDELSQCTRISDVAMKIFQVRPHFIASLPTEAKFTGQAALSVTVLINVSAPVTTPAGIVQREYAELMGAQSYAEVLNIRNIRWDCVEREMLDRRRNLEKYQAFTRVGIPAYGDRLLQMEICDILVTALAALREEDVRNTTVASADPPQPGPVRPETLWSVAMQTERRYRILVKDIHQYDGTFATALWYPSAVEVGAVGYISKPKGGFVTLMNAVEGCAAKFLPALGARGINKRYYGTKETVSDRLTAYVQSNQRLLRVHAWALEAGRPTAGVFTKHAKQKTFDANGMANATTWLTSYIDTIVREYGRDLPIQREDIFLVTGTIASSNYALFVTDPVATCYAYFNVFRPRKNDEPWGAFTVQSEGEREDFPSNAHFKCKVSRTRTLDTILLSAIRVPPQPLKRRESDPILLCVPPQTLKRSNSIG